MVNLLLHLLIHQTNKKSLFQNPDSLLSCRAKKGFRIAKKQECFSIQNIHKKLTLEYEQCRKFQRSYKRTAKNLTKKNS